MSAPMGVIVKCISSIVIKLVNKTKSQRTQDSYGDCRNKISSCDLIRYKWSNKISYRINDEN